MWKQKSKENNVECPDTPLISPVCHSLRNRKNLILPGSQEVTERPDLRSHQLY
jgi:hypothetical protein